MYGGGTSVVGHINPKRHGKLNLTISMANMTRLLDLDPISMLADFNPEQMVHKLRINLMRRDYTRSFSTIMGILHSRRLDCLRSSGQQSLKYGRIENLFAGGKIVTPKGTLVIPTCPASSTRPIYVNFF